MKPYTLKPLFTVPVTTDLIWASAAYAYRVNEGYCKYHVSPLNAQGNIGEVYIADGIVTNQRLAHYAIMYPDIMSDEDYIVGKEMLAHFGGIVFKALTKDLTDFEKAVLQAVERKDWNDQYEKHRRQHFGIVISLPGTYYREVDREREKMVLARAHHSFIGKEKERLPLKIQVIGNVFSEQWQTHYITAMTLDHNAVFFSYKTELPINKIYNIVGTVKAHRENYQTQLNRVKITQEY